MTHCTALVSNVDGPPAAVPVPSGLRIHSPALHALPSGASEDIQDLSSSSETASSDSVQPSPAFSQSVSLPAEPSEISQGPNNLRAANPYVFARIYMFIFISFTGNIEENRGHRRFKMVSHLNNNMYQKNQESGL